MTVSSCVYGILESFKCWSLGSMTASKPPAKGIDLDAVGTVSGVPVYEFDMESIKMEDKPWRKPGLIFK